VPGQKEQPVTFKTCNKPALKRNKKGERTRRKQFKKEINAKAVDKCRKRRGETMG